MHDTTLARRVEIRAYHLTAQAWIARYFAGIDSNGHASASARQALAIAGNAAAVIQDLTRGGTLPNAS